MDKTFILADEKVNKYGFRVLMSGARLDNFKKNPVMLFNHRDWGSDYDGPPGRWGDIRVEGNKLLATPEFDMEDEKGKKLAGKVDRGFLKGASIGFDIISVSDDPAVMLKGQRYPTVTEWEPFEASVVDVPASSSALLLRYQGETILVEKESDMAKLGAFEKQPNLNNDTMELSEALLKELGLGKGASEDQAIQAAKQLKKKADDATKTLNDQREARVEKLVSEAQERLKFDEARKQTLMRLGKQDVELLEQTIEVMQPREKLKNQIEDDGKGGNNDAKRKDWTLRDWEKKDPKGLLKKKTEDPEWYQEMFNQEYKK